VDGTPVKPALVRTGDVQFAEVTVAGSAQQTTAEFRYRGGTDVYIKAEAPRPGARSEGIRILRSRADATALRLLVEGVNGRSYDLFLRSPRQPGEARGATLSRGSGTDPIIRIPFEGPPGEYSRREVVVTLR
jgi:hypothetical protein